MVTARLRIVDWAARAEGCESKAQWQAWAGVAASPTAASPRAGMPMMLRRRLGPLGQRAIASAYEAGAGPGARFIFSSRHGDLRRTASLLAALAAREPLSPAEFSVSVHNAFAGLLSIAMQATAGHTALAAGPDSFASGLVEALGCLEAAPAEPVLLVYYDEEPPAPYDVLAIPTGESLALAVLLAAESRASASAVLAEVAVARGTSEPTETTRQAFDCVRFLASGATTQYSRGGRIHLEWRRC
jgi:hypothetical protein